METDILNQVLKAAGGGVQLAKHLGCTHQAIYNWRRIPVERVLTIEKLTGIHRSTLRPDIYPPEPV